MFRLLLMIFLFTPLIAAEKQVYDRDPEKWNIYVRNKLHKIEETLKLMKAYRLPSYAKEAANQVLDMIQEFKQGTTLEDYKTNPKQSLQATADFSRRTTLPLDIRIDELPKNANILLGDAIFLFEDIIVACDMPPHDLESVMLEYPQEAKSQVNMKPIYPLHQPPGVRINYFHNIDEVFEEEFGEFLEKWKATGDPDKAAKALVKWAENNPYIATARAFAVTADPQRVYHKDHVALVKHGILPYLIMGLQCDVVSTQIYAALALNNMASDLGSKRSRTAKAIIKSGAVEALCDCLESENRSLKNFALMALGNLVGDEIENCEAVINRRDVLKYLTKIIEKDLNSTDKEASGTLKQASWVLNNLVYGCADNYVKYKIDIYDKLIRKLIVEKNSEVVMNAWWTVHALSCWLKGRFEEETGILRDNLDRLKSDDLRIVFAIIYSLNNILHQETIEDYGQTLISRDVLPMMTDLYSKHNNEELILAVTQFFANISSTTDEKVLQAILDLNILPRFVKLMTHKNDNIKDAAVKAIFGVAKSKNPANAKKLVKTPELIGTLGTFIRHPDKAVVKNIGLAIFYLQNTASMSKEVFEIMKENGLYNEYVQWLSHSEEVRAMMNHAREKFEKEDRDEL